MCDGVLVDGDCTALRCKNKPAEGVWSWTKRGITNIAVHGIDHLAGIIRQRLRACQQQTDLIAGFLAQTGMTLEPEPP